MADPTGKAARVARSRAACSGCRQTKQRCDGPSRIPCRRCELYGLACEYPPSSGPAASKPAIAKGSPLPTYLPPPSQTGAYQQDPMMAERLREISERLRSIESTLAGVHLSPPAHGNSSTTDGASPASSITHSHSEPGSHTSQHHQMGETPDPAGFAMNAKFNTPMQDVISQVDAIEAITKTQSPSNSPKDWASSALNSVNASLSRLFAGMTMPDAVVRGIMSGQECEASFNIFFTRLAPWAMIFDPERDNNPSAMRERSPFLFHVILLTTSYYLMEASDRGAQIYYALTALVNELLAPLIISAQPHQVNSDFVRALHLLLLYKPIQYAALYTVGITDPDAAEHAAKLNGFSGSILSGLLARTGIAIGLPSTCSAFAKAYSPTIAMAPQLLSDLRLHYWLCSVDTHGALTTGRPGSADMVEAVKTTRMFASLKQLNTDVRLAATVELYAAAKHAVASMWSTGSKIIPPHELRKFNKDIDDWEAYWREPLRKAGEDGDRIAYVVNTVMANFIRVVINSSVFTRWQAERAVSLAEGGSGRPHLSDDDWSFIAKAVESAERLVFSLSTESRVNGSTYERAVNWPPAVNFKRPRLNLDPVVVDMHKTAFDTVTSVMYIFVFILLAKLANTGLIRCELITLVEEYNAGISLNRPQKLVEGAKVGRLFELGAAFLEAISPTSSHPAKRHARMLRTIVAAGTMGIVRPLAENEAESEPQSPAAAEAIGVTSSSYNTVQHSAVTADGLSNGAKPDAYPANGVHMDLQVPSLPYDASLPSQGGDSSGEALAAILGGLSPSWLNQIGYNEASTVQEANNILDGMAVDWDALEKSIALQQQQTPSFSPLPTSFFNYGNPGPR